MARIEINLLPRELRRKRKGITLDKNLTLVAGLVGILAVLILTASILQTIKLKGLDEKIAEAQIKVNQLKQKIELVDALTDLKDKVLKRMSAIETLDKNRAVWVRVLEDLSRRVPDYLWLSLVQEEGQDVAPPDTTADTTALSSQFAPQTKRMTIEGYSFSLSGLASFLIQLAESDYFKNMELQYVKRAEIKEYKAFAFQLVGKLYYQPEFENPHADTSAQKLALQNESKGSEVNSAINLVAGGE